MPESSGKCCRRPTEIWRGDQLRCSLRATQRHSLGRRASRQFCGRRARRQAAASESAARYPWRPPLRPTSLLIVEGARPNRAAIARKDAPDARPREISSLSAARSARSDRTWGLGAIPPRRLTSMKTVAYLRSNPRAISATERPLLHPSQRTRRSSGENEILLMPHPPSDFKQQGVASTGLRHPDPGVTEGV